MPKMKCRICNYDDDEWWCSDYTFGTLCQNCRMKYTIRLMEVAKKVCDKEIKKIKKEIKEIMDEFENETETKKES